MTYSRNTLSKKYGEMYDILKKFHEDVKYYGWGEGSLPSKYTEDLCKEIFSFKDRNSKSHDAIDSKGNKIEIKATIGGASATSINTELLFDKLYWLRFDFKEDTVHIKIYSKMEVKSYLKSNDKLSGSRENITLNKILLNKKDDHTIDFKKT